MTVSNIDEMLINEKIYIQLCVHCRRYFAFYIFDWISEIEMRC